MVLFITINMTQLMTDLDSVVALALTENKKKYLTGGRRGYNRLHTKALLLTTLDASYVVMASSLCIPANWRLFLKQPSYSNSCFDNNKNSV